MKRFTTMLVLTLVAMLVTSTAFAQLSGPKSIPGDYATVALAIADLNTVGVGVGGVTFNVAAGHTETFASLTAGTITATGTASDPIVFQKSGGGANPVITAATPGVSTTVDGIITLVGSDYVTFDAIDLIENAANTTATMQMEWGYGLVNVDSTNGSQNNTIRNSTITLNKANTASCGIYQNIHGAAATTLPASIPSALGTASNNKYYSNNITNVYFGIKVLGLSTNMNTGNEVGVGGGNVITNWGGGSTSAFAINANSETNLKISNNNISGGTGTSTFRGMYVGTFSVGANIDILNNTISGLVSSATTSSFVGVELNSSLGTVNFRGNTITGNTYPTATSGTFRGFYYNAAAATVLNVDSNFVTNNTLPGTGALEALSVATSTTATLLNVRGNYVNGNLKTGASGSFYGMRLNTATVVVAGNQILSNGSAVANTSTFYGIYDLSAPIAEDYYNNTIRGLYNGGAGTMVGIESNTSASSIKNIYNNVIDSLYTAGTGVGIHGIRTALAATARIYNNTIRNINAAGASGVANGMTITSGTTVHIYNNYISDLKAPNATGTTQAVAGINIAGGTTVNAYYNTIYLNATSSSATGFGTSGIFSSTTPTVDLRNNNVVNLSTPGPVTGSTAAYRRSSTTLTTFAAASNNNNFYVNPAAGVRRYHYSQGLTVPADNDSTIGAYKTRVSPRCSNAIAENPPFVNVATTPYDLHMNTGIATQTESGGTPVTTPIAVADDFDGNARNGTTPDIGADEFAGVALDLTSPSISYTPLLNTNLLTARTLTASITDAGSGVPTAGAGLPVLYWRVNGGSYSAATGAFTSGSSYDFSFGGGVATGDTVYYYIAAQDGATPPNVGAAPSAGASGFTANPPAASTPPTTPSRYVVAAAGLAGDYTVGLTLFNRVTGKNVTFERVVTRELREVPEMVAVANVKGENSLTASTEAGYVATGRMVMKEVEQISWVPMESGRPYTGELYMKRAENPNLSPDAHAGIYATITAAVADLNLRGVSGATRLLLVDATYPTETFPITVNIQSVNGTSAVNTVTIKPSTGVVATVSGAAASTQIMKILNSYVTIDGSNAPAGTTRDLTLSNTSVTTPQVLVIGSVGTTPNVGSGAKNTVFINGINTSSAVIISDGTVAGNPGYFNNITFQNNSIQKAYIGMYNNAVVAAGNGSGHSITGNELNTVGVNAVRYVGLYVQGVDGATISGNTIANFDGTSAEDDRAMWLATGTKNVVVEKNFMHSLNYTGTGGYGTYGMAVSTATTGANIEIRNNMIYNLSGDGWNYTSILGYNTHGLYIFSVQTGVKVYHNSINLYGNTLNQTSAMSSGITLGNGSTADIRNNIVVNNLGLLAAIGYGSTGIFLQAAASQYEAGNYNDIHVNPTGTGTKNIGQIVTTASTTLAAWQTATSQEANSVSADPGFVSNTNLHINTSAISPADSAGTPLAGITTDIDNNTRDAVRPDIGADEFTYVAPILPPNCAVNVSPADLATNVLIGATLNWASGGGGPTGYKVFFGTDNPPTNIANGTDLGLVTSYDPTPNMAYNTIYFWRIVPYNTSGDATGCAIWSFTTEADPTITSFPYAEGFESLTFPPAGWSNQAAKLWSRGSESAFGSGAARSIYQPIGTSILQMPPVALPANHRANFYWKDDDISASLVEGFDTTWFEISTNAGASWTSLALLSAPAPQSSYVQEMVDLSAYGGTTVLLRWRDWTDGTFDAWGIGVDSVRIEAIPSNDIGVTSVDVPSLLAAPSAGSSSSEVSREMASRGGESAVPSVGITLEPLGNLTGDAPINFLARIENFGSTTIASYQVGWHLNGTNQTSVNNTAPIAGGAVDSLVLTWASPTEGSHSIRAWTLLGGDTNPANDSSATFTFEVLPANVIFNQAFNGSFPPAGWTTVNRDGGGTSGPWFAGNTAVFPAKEGTGYAGDNYQSANGFYIDDYLISPNTGGLDDALVTDSLTFWLRAPEGSIYNDSLEVRVSTTGSDTSNFTMLLDYIWADTTGAWKRYAYVLPNGANRYIAFRYLHYEGGPAGNYSNYIGLDDIRISRYAGGGTVTIGVPVALNWNIVSLPVSSPTPDDSVKHLFTNSINPYAFAFTGSYQQRYVMINAPGYWIKSSAAYTQDVIGTSLDNLTVPVNSGWNMIGSISTAIDTASAFVTPSVPGLRGSNYFRYSAGYVVTNTISPGLGYWVKANSAGSFLMHTTGASRPAPAQNATSTGRTIDDLNSITIRDANGGSQTLYFGTDGKNEIPVAMFVMPPSPPEGSFDARFRSNEGGTMVQVHSEDITAVTELPISLQSSAYPLTVTWQLRGGTAEYELTDGAGGVHPLRGEGAVRINGDVNTIALRLSGNSALPKEFALSQNYPNPFNPTTNITFALPVQSRVTAEIYNMLGQRVSTLVKEDRAAGFHVVEWNGTSTTGVQVGSGTYFLRLSATGANGRVFTEVKKLLMLK